jgi:hypothetical protein
MIMFPPKIEQFRIGHFGWIRLFAPALQPLQERVVLVEDPSHDVTSAAMVNAKISRANLSSMAPGGQVNLPEEYFS